MQRKTDQKSSKKHIIKLLILIYVGLFLALVLLWAANLGWHMIDLYSLAKNLQKDPGLVQSNNVVPLVGRASHDVNTIYNQLNPLFPLSNALHTIPWAGKYLGQVDPLLTYTNALSLAGNEIALGLAPLLDKNQAGQAGLSLPELANQATKGSQDHFIAAASYIDQASQVRRRIDPQVLPEPARSLFMKLDSNFDLLVAGAQLLMAAPQLLGDDQAQNYLILAQNRDELRATGGFISGIGLLTLQDGKIVQFSLGDSYAVDDFTKPYPPPPEALHRFMLSDYWVTRDANWSPDFPTAARQAQALYTLSTGIQTQGVIAFNQLAIMGLLNAVGPVKVPGVDATITSQNVEDYMRQAWAPAPEQGLSGDWWQHRKDFMQLLGSVLLEKILSASDQAQLLNLAKTIFTLLNQGQILVYFDSKSAESALQTAGWDGAVHPGNGDYLFLVDSNVGFNKMDTLIQRSVTYQVDLSDISHPAGKLTISYQNTAAGNVPCKQVASYGNGTYQDMQVRCYWDYWRLYTPAGTQLVTSNAQPVPAEDLLSGQGWPGRVEILPGEANTQVFAGMLVLPLTQSIQNELSSFLPPSVVQSTDIGNWVYRLDVKLQPGVNRLPFQLEVKLPKNTLSTSPGEDWRSVSPGIWTWQGELDRSVEFRVQISDKS